MAVPTWTYSDWITYDEASASRLSQLRLHVQEVSNFISSGNYQITGRDVKVEAVQKYLEGIKADERREAKAYGIASGNRVSFTRGRALLSDGTGGE